MYRTHKSATCCYCGSKTILTLSSGSRHELKCSACGAPLSRMKSLREDHVDDIFTAKGKKSKKPYQPKTKTPKKKKKRKTTMHRLFDVAEDIFDIFD